MIFIGLVIILLVVIIYMARKSKKEEEQAQSQPVQQDKPQHGWQYMSLIGEVKRQAEERGDQETVQECLNLTYDSQMPIRKPDGSYTSIYNPLWDFNIAGINFRKGIKKYVGEFFGYIQPEPTNEYDPDAIAIYHSDGHHLGYIPADFTDEIRELGFPFPLQVFGWIEEDHDDDDNRDYFRGTVYIEIPDANRLHPVKKEIK